MSGHRYTRLLTVIGSALFSYSVTATAQITVDPKAPGNQQPTLLQTPNGLPLVNIQTPSAAGVSRNSYRQFDVQQQGAVLNNSRTSTQTQLGGWVQGNPWLSQGEARIILNEVNSSRPSHLSGYIEVAGQRAEVIIANPAGISVDGGGFINTSRATLTTGTPILQGGSLEGYRVREGTIAIRGQGLDTSQTDYTQLLSRAVEVNAGIWAQDLQVVTGVNDIAYSGGAVGAVRTSSSDQPDREFALDVAALGGMYAGKITLIGTEAGLGVSNAGHIGASAGEIAITADGRLVNTGSITASGEAGAAGDLAIRSGDGISNDGGSIYAQGNARLDSGGNVDNRRGGLIAAQGNVDIETTGRNSRIASDRQSSLVAGMTPDGALATAGASELSLRAGESVQLQGQGIATGDVRLQADVLDLSGSLISGNRVAAVAQAGDIRATGAQLSADNMQLHTRHTLHTDQAELTAEQLELQAHSWNNRQGSVVQTGAADLELALEGDFINTDGYLASNSETLTIQAHRLDNRQGQILAVESAELTVQEELNNTDGLLTANRSLSIQAGALDNAEGVIQSTQADVKVQVSGRLDNTGLLQAEQDLQVDAGQLSNTGDLYSYDGSVRLNVEGRAENAGLIAARGDVGLTAGEFVSSAEATLAAGLLAGGDLAETADLSIRTQNDLHIGGQVLSAGNLDIDAAGMQLEQGQLQAIGRLRIEADHLENAAGSEIVSGGDAQFAIREALNNLGQMQSAGHLHMAAEQLANAAGADIVSSSDAQLAVQGGLVNEGRLLAAGHLQVDAGDFTNAAGAEVAGDNVALSVRQALRNRGHLQAVDRLDIDARTLDNSVDGEIVSSNETRIRVQNTLTNRGLIDGRLTHLQAGTLTNIGTGRIYGGVLAIAADVLRNREETVAGVTTAGTIAARERLELGVGRLYNQENALIYSAGDMHIGGELDDELNARGEAALLHNASATIEAIGNLSLTVANLRNTNEHFATRLARTLAPTERMYIQPKGQSERIPVEELVWRNWSRAGEYRYRTDDIGEDSGILGASPIPRVGEQDCEGEDEATEVCVLLSGADYPAGDPAWAYFNIHAPEPEPVAPALVQPVEPDPVAQASCQEGGGYDEAACSAYTLALAQYTADLTAYETAWNQYAQSLAAWEADTVARYEQLDSAIEEYNEGFEDSRIRSWTQYIVTRTEWETEVVASAPGQILAGGDMQLNSSGSIVNDKSHIIAGGALTGSLDRLDNIDAVGEHIIREVGTSQASNRRWRGGFKRYHQRDWKAVLDYSPPDEVVTITLPVTRQEANTRSAGSGYRVTAAATVAGVPAGSPPGTITEVSAVDNLGRQEAGTLIRTATPDATPPSASLYSQHPDPSASYLIETDPRFASYKDWLGSDYMLDILKVDGDVTQKRLGDGFYEQRLIREQINQVTGRNLLADYSSEEEQYRSLMDAGLAFAHEHRLIPGVALTAEQMAQLTRDIVWLVEQEVVLADGSVQKVLVPQVYVQVDEGELQGDGGLIAANSIELELDGNLTNSALLAGRTSVAVDADNIDNLGGRLQGSDLNLAAREDINNIGGQIRAGNSIDLTAGGDIRVESTTHSASTQAGQSSFSRTGLDRLAGIYLDGDAQGGMRLEAGGDLSLIGAELSNQGEQGTQLLAGGDVSIGSLELEQTTSLVQNRNNFNQYGSSQHYGSRVDSAGDLTIQAGGAATIHASDLSAEGTLSIGADSIAITAGVNESTLQQGYVSTTSSRRHTYSGGYVEQTAAGSSLSGGNIQLQANDTIRVTASALTAEQDLMIGNLRVEQQEDGSFKAINGEGTPDQLIVDTLALQNERWSETSTSYRGAVGSLTKAAAVGVALAMDVVAPGIDKPTFTLSESSSERTASTTHQDSWLDAGKDLIMAASEQIKVIAGELSAGGTAVLSAADVSLDAIADTHSSETSQSRATVGGVGMSAGRDEITLGGMELTDETTTQRTTATTYRGTSVNAGNLVMLAEQDISLLSSDVNVAGDALLQAGGDIHIGGYQDEIVTEVHQDTETTRVTAGVRNAYVDAGYAVEAVYEAGKAVEDARSQYRAAKRQVERGELAESALQDYEINLAAATANLAQAQIAAGGAVASAATTASTSAGTGFYANVNAEHTQTSSSQSDTQKLWQGSRIQAGSLTLNSTNATIQGSDISAGLLNLGSQNVLITAGTSSATTEASSSSRSATASASTRGNVSAGVSRSESESSSSTTQHINSRINAGHLVSDSDNLILRGAEVQAETAHLDVGNLHVESLQDTHSSRNNSRSDNLGLSVSGSGITPTGGVNRGNGSSDARQVGQQTQLLIADGENSEIRARNTTLVGGLIANATVNEDGSLQDHGQLSLDTNTLTISHLEDRSHSQQSGFGVQTGFGVQSGSNVQAGSNDTSGTTSLTMQNEGHITEGRTQATLGQGNIRVGGQLLEDSDGPDGLNRDLAQGQITTRDQQTAGLDAGVTVDHRLLSETGREEIFQQQRDLV
ncbi:hemagglutinin repeat-containing protein, partial [Alkalilimnicola ehrlichii]